VLKLLIQNGANVSKEALDKTLCRHVVLEDASNVLWENAKDMTPERKAGLQKLEVLFQWGFSKVDGTLKVLEDVKGMTSEQKAGLQELWASLQ
jgi:hypothetical protein